LSISNDYITMHILFIVLHTISGLLAFIYGWISLHKLENNSLKKLFLTFLISLICLDIFMIGAIIVDIPSLSQGQLFTFSGLTLLGLYMLYRGYQAYLVQKSRRNNWKIPFIEHVGFNLISLFDGFVIVLAIDLKFPVWGTITIGILGVIIGISVVNRIKLKTKAGSSGSG